MESAVHPVAREFPSTGEMVVAVDTYNAAGQPDAATAERAEQLVDELGARLQRSDAANSVLWGFAPSCASGRTIRLEPMPQFKTDLAQLDRARPLLESPTPSALLARAVQQMQSGGQSAAGGAAASQTAATSPTNQPAANPAAQITQFENFINAFTYRLKTPVNQPVDLGRQIEQAGQGKGDNEAAAAPNDWRYLQSDNGRLLFVRINPKADPAALNPYRASIGKVRQILANMHSRYPSLQFGLTGIEVLQADETAAATADSTKASIVAVVLIALVLIIAFHSFRVPLMLIITLAVGIAWSFGFLTLVIGHLQVISVVFVVLLLGLGVAFGIHLASGFELLRHRYPDTEAGFRDTLQQTLETIGPGMVTGAVTTAAAFATTIFTDFRGVAEMGMVAGMGVILCLIAMCSVYPAMLRLLKPSHRHFKPMESRRVHLFEERWIMPFVHHPRWTLIAAAVLMLASVAAIVQMRFDYNLMALMPRGVESVQWQRRIVQQGNQSVWTATSIADSMKEAREHAQAFRNLPTVESVGGIATLFPTQPEQREQMIAQVRQRLGNEVEQALQSPASAPAATTPAATTPAATTPAATSAASSQTTPTPQTPAQTFSADDEQLVQEIRSLNTFLPWVARSAPPDVQAKLGELRGSLQNFLNTADALPPEQRASALPPFATTISAGARMSHSVCMRFCRPARCSSAICRANCCDRMWAKVQMVSNCTHWRFIRKYPKV